MRPGHGWLNERRSTFVVLAALVAWLLPISLGRLIDGDEGYLLMAARLVSEGRLPYRDFFLPQGPLLPVSVGLGFLVARSWLVARLFAAALVVAMGYLVYRVTLGLAGSADAPGWNAPGKPRPRAAAYLATALFAAAGATEGWLTIIKGYGLATLCLLIAVLLVDHVRARAAGADPFGGKRLHLVVGGAGLACGLAASARLYTAAVMPGLALYLLVHTGSGRTSLRSLLAFALGGALGSLPLVLGYLVGGQAFVFDVLLFHGVREYGQDSLFGAAGQKLPPVLTALGFHPDASVGDRQSMGLLLAGLLSAAAHLRGARSTGSAAAWVWPPLLLASVLPNPFYRQYLCMLVPFLAIEAGRLYATLRTWTSQRRGRWPLALCCAVLVYLGYHFAVGVRERSRYLVTGKGVPGIWSVDRVPRWRIATVEAVARSIDAQGVAVGASWWPGYFVSSRTAITVELANDFGLRAAEALAPEQRRRFHVAPAADLQAMMGARHPRLFVEGNWAQQPVANLLPLMGYALRDTVGNVRIWVAK